MCGVCGVIGRDALRAVEAMTRAMRHRGPDDGGVADFGGAALGMRRLAILDTTSAGRQPMSSPDGLVTLVYNGETYNFMELRRRLEARGHGFVSHGDTETVLRLYLDEGPRFVSSLRGMFALALYDRRGGPGREKLLLARDPLGIKPLLYHEQGGGIAFASEMKALLAGGRTGRDIDPESLRLLLTFGSVSQPRTMLRGVFMLPPGCVLTFEGGCARLERYYFMRADAPELARMDYGEQVQALREVLAGSVRSQMVSDVPLGAFLSGGLDSALLCALMLDAGQRDLNTFSVGFEAEGEHVDESREAFHTAAHLGTRHHLVTVSGRDVASALPDIARALDQPSVDGVNSYFVSQAARRRVTVALSGTGGDELFAGYPWFAHMRDWAGRDAAVGLSPRRAFGRMAHHGALDRLAHGPLGPWLEERRSEAGFLAQYAMRYYIFGPTGAARMLAPGLRRPARSGRAMALDMASQDELAGQDPLCRVSGLCLRGYTANQLLRDIDSVSMAHSLEVRVPYLDTKVLGAALSLPPTSKLGGRTGFPADYQGGLKRILHDIARPYLPEDFGARAKRGFAMPFESWLRGPLRDVFEDATGPDAVARAGLLDPAATGGIRSAFLAGELMWMKPWLLMMIELWRREVLDAPPDTEREWKRC